MASSVSFPTIAGLAVGMSVAGGCYFGPKINPSWFTEVGEVLKKSPAMRGVVAGAATLVMLPVVASAVSSVIGAIRNNRSEDSSAPEQDKEKTAKEELTELKNYITSKEVEGGGSAFHRLQAKRRVEGLLEAHEIRAQRQTDEIASLKQRLTNVKEGRGDAQTRTVLTAQKALQVLKGEIQYEALSSEEQTQFNLINNVIRGLSAAEPAAGARGGHGGRGRFGGGR